MAAVGVDVSVSVVMAMVVAVAMLILIHSQALFSSGLVRGHTNQQGGEGVKREGKNGGCCCGVSVFRNQLG